MIVAGLTVVILLVHLAIDCIRGQTDFLSLATLSSILDALTIGVTIIVVAVPEVQSIE